MFGHDSHGLKTEDAPSLELAGAAIPLSLSGPAWDFFCRYLADAFETFYHLSYHITNPALRYRYALSLLRSRFAVQGDGCRGAGRRADGPSC